MKVLPKLFQKGDSSRHAERAVDLSQSPPSSPKPASSPPHTRRDASKSKMLPSLSIYGHMNQFIAPPHKLCRPIN